MTAAEYAQGLRDFADWVEAHREALESDLASEQNGGQRLLICCLTRETFLAKLALLDAPQRVLTDRYFAVEQTFGPIKAYVYIDREKIGREEYVIDDPAIAAVPEAVA